MNVLMKLKMAVFAFGTLLLTVAPAAALDKLVVGKAFPVSYAFAPINVGVDSGIMAKYGLDVKIVSFIGSAKLQQGMLAGDVDVGLGSGTNMAFVVKGVPELAVAAFLGPPLYLGIFVGNHTGIHMVHDLKDKKIGVADRNSIVYYFTRHLSKQLGWGLDGIHIIYVSGGAAANLAAITTGQIAGTALGIDTGRLYQVQDRGKLVVNFGNYVKSFITHAIFASDTLMKSRPDVLRRFI